MSSTKWEKVANLPEGVGSFVAMTVFNDKLVVAMEGGVFYLDDDENLFVEIPLEKSNDPVL